MASMNTDNETDQEEFEEEQSEIEEFSDSEDNEDKANLSTATISTSSSTAKSTLTSAKKRRSTQPRKLSTKAVNSSESSSEIKDTSEAEEGCSDEYADGGVVKKQRNSGTAGERKRGRVGRGALSAKKKKYTKNRKKKADDNGGENKKHWVDDISTDAGEEDSSGSERPPEFKSGCFIVLKTDFDNERDYYLWRVDGRSLIRRFDRYKNNGNDFFFQKTTMYSLLVKKDFPHYYPIQVQYVEIDGKWNGVKLDVSQIKPKKKETN